MATVVFLPSGIQSDIEDNTKILLAAKKARIDIRFGCASCRCGTCGVLLKAGQESAKKSQYYSPSDFLTRGKQ